MEITEQDKIADWFNETYSTKGYNYLRPLEAYNIFVNILNPKEGSKHLDVACGLGLMLKVLEDRKMALYGVDISEIAVKCCKEFCPEANVELANAESLPFDDNIFDSLTCLGSLERMINRSKAIKEQIRVAKQGADFCYMVRNSENFTWRYIKKPFGLRNEVGHQDAQSLQEWKKLFEEAGLKIINVYADHWPYYRFLRFFLPNNKVDTSKIYKFPFKVTMAYEFIFHLKKV